MVLRSGSWSIGSLKVRPASNTKDKKKRKEEDEEEEEEDEEDAEQKEEEEEDREEGTGKRTKKKKTEKQKKMKSHLRRLFEASLFPEFCDHFRQPSPLRRGVQRARFTVWAASGGVFTSHNEVVKWCRKSTSPPNRQLKFQLVKVNNKLTIWWGS